MSELLDQITHANDIQSIDPMQYTELAAEIRRFLLKNVSRTGGHLASNLGTVELTMALHLCMNFPEDKLIWDVGHQAYTHKILTGRKEQMGSLRQWHGISGFPKHHENKCDAFDTGHSSTSLSVGLGLAHARDIKGTREKIFAVIGDGALSGGMAFEALNNAAALKSNLVIVLNDNKMSISENVGGMANYLGRIRTNDRYQNLKGNVEQVLLKMPGGSSLVRKIRKSKDSLKRLIIPGMLFEDMGITYIGPVDGHDINEMLTAFHSAMKMEEPVLVHVKTKKGKGYRLAEQDPSTFHGIDPFYVKTGELRNQVKRESYTNVFGKRLVTLAKEDPSIVAVSAAMPNGTGLTQFADLFPDRFFDVGIAEEHAVTFAAGLAAGGLKPVVALYSTFLQRAYDQILHDVCISGFPVVLAIDRAGIVGNDGETHQGIYDLAFLSTIPGMTIIAPKNKREFEEMLSFCFSYGAPIAIRYPRGAAFEGLNEKQEPIAVGKAEVLYEEKEILLLAVGSMVATADKVRTRLREMGHSCSLVNMRFVKPLDLECVGRLSEKHSVVVTLEENACNGGMGQQIGAFLATKERQPAWVSICLPDQYVEQGMPDKLKKVYGLDVEGIIERIPL